jgi:hypothetical protein
MIARYVIIGLFQQKNQSEAMRFVPRNRAACVIYSKFGSWPFLDFIEAAEMTHGMSAAHRHQNSNRSVVE